MKKFNDEQLSRVLSHVGGMHVNGGTGPGCLVQTALGSDFGQTPGYMAAEMWFDYNGYKIEAPDELLRALEGQGLA